MLDARKLQTEPGLFADLKNFGLDPKDWHLDRPLRAFSREVSFRHREDAQFRLKGRVKRRKSSFSLDSLSLASL